MKRSMFHYRNNYWWMRRRRRRQTKIEYFLHFNSQLKIRYYVPWLIWMDSMRHIVLGLASFEIIFNQDCNRIASFGPWWIIFLAIACHRNELLLYQLQHMGCHVVDKLQLELERKLFEEKYIDPIWFRVLPELKTKFFVNYVFNAIYLNYPN